MNKNIYHIKFLILFLVLSTELISQVNTTWTKYYGGTNSDGGYSLSQTSDGGYIIAGATASYGNGDYDVYLIKTNSTGDVSWTQTFGGSESDGAYSVRQTLDGGYIIAGYTESSNDYNSTL